MLLSQINVKINIKLGFNIVNGKLFSKQIQYDKI